MQIFKQLHIHLFSFTVYFPACMSPQPQCPSLLPFFSSKLKFTSSANDGVGIVREGSNPYGYNKSSLLSTYIQNIGQKTLCEHRR